MYFTYLSGFNVTHLLQYYFIIPNFQPFYLSGKEKKNVNIVIFKDVVWFYLFDYFYLSD